MYEVRQNKEKVSRRIDGGGMAKQRMQLENTFGMKQSDANGILQLIKSDYDNSVEIYDNGKDAKEHEKRYALIIGTQTGGDVNFMGHSGLMLEGYYEGNEDGNIVKNHWHQMAHFFPANANDSIIKKIMGVGGKVEERNGEDAKNEFNKYGDKVVYSINSYDKLQNAQTKIKQDKEKAPNYRLLWHNCATWTSNVAKEAGVFWNIPIPYLRPAAMMSWKGYLKSWSK